MLRLMMPESVSRSFMAARPRSVVVGPASLALGTDSRSKTSTLDSFCPGWDARPMDLDEVLADLWAENTELDMVVAGLAADAWATPTPAEGWSIAHQIAHLAWTDEAALSAMTDRDEFQATLQRAAADPAGYVDKGAAEGAALPTDQLLPYWRETRAELAEALKQVPAGEKIAWFGPPVSATSMATARLMETWAHGQDIHDGLGVSRQPSSRLRHVAH